MQVQIVHQPGKNPSNIEIGAWLRSLADMYDPRGTKVVKAAKPDDATDEDEEQEEAPKKSRGRPKKAATPADDADDEDTDSDDDADDEDTDTSETEDDFEDDAEDEKPAKAAKGKYTKDDVRTALKAYAKKHGKDKAMKVLKKLNVSMIDDIKPTQFEAAMALAKV